jgi:hypothetical protein
LLQGLLAGTQQAAQGFQIGAANRRQESLDQQAAADRDFQRQRIVADDEQQKRDRVLRLLLSAKADDPTNPQPYNKLATDLETGSAMYGQPRRQQGAFAAGAQAFMRPFQESGAAPIPVPEKRSLAQITPGPTPYALSQQAAERARLLKMEDNRRNFEQQKALAELQNKLGQPKDALSILGSLLEKGYTGQQVAPLIRGQFPGVDLGAAAQPDLVIPGEMPERTLEPAPDAEAALLGGLRSRQMPERTIGQPSTDPLLQRLSGLLRGQSPAANNLGPLNLPEPDQIIPGGPGLLESLPIAPKVAADLAASNAALATSTESLETTRENRRIAGAKEAREAEAFPTIQQGRQADVELKRAQAANVRLMPDIKKAEFALRDKSLNNQARIADVRNGLDAMAHNLQRQKFDWERAQQRLDPITKERISGIDAEMEQAHRTASRYADPQNGDPNPDEARKWFEKYRSLKDQRDNLLGGKIYANPREAVQDAIKAWERTHGVKAQQADINRISQLIRSRYKRQ